jgi:hypothetical protein
LLNSSQQLGGALGIAIFTAIATSHTQRLLGDHTPVTEALAAGFHRALIAAALFLIAAGLIAFRATNTKGEEAPATESSVEPALA